MPSDLAKLVAATMETLAGLKQAVEDVVTAAEGEQDATNHRYLLNNILRVQNITDRTIGDLRFALRAVGR